MADHEAKLGRVSARSRTKPRRNVANSLVHRANSRPGNVRPDCLNSSMTSRPDDLDRTPSATGMPATLARIRSEVSGLVDTLWTARDRSELMGTVAEIEALKSTLDAVELGAVRELEATEAVKGAGWSSTQDYVTVASGGHKGAGPATVRLATAVTEPLMAPVGEALRDGWLSTAKAQVIERAIDSLPGDPGLRRRGLQVLLDTAKTLDATELRKLTQRLLTVVDPDGDERRDERALDRLERAAHLTRHLTITDDQAGGAWIKGRCTSEDAALVKASLIPLAKPQPADDDLCSPEACDSPGCSHDGRDPRDHGVRMLDALVEACGRLQSAELLPESHGAVPRLTLAFLDAPSRTVGWGPTFFPTGDVRADMDRIREFYADKTGIRPESFTPPRLRDEPGA